MKASYYIGRMGIKTLWEVLPFQRKSFRKSYPAAIRMSVAWVRRFSKETGYTIVGW